MSRVRSNTIYFNLTTCHVKTYEVVLLDPIQSKKCFSVGCYSVDSVLGLSMYNYIKKMFVFTFLYVSSHAF